MDSYERQLTAKEIDILHSSRNADGQIGIAFRKSLKTWKCPEIKSGAWTAGNVPTTTEGPFGEPLRATGVLADSNPFRFSSKYQDNETGLLYYGYRYYQPIAGRWLNRDPIGEKGGRNIYAFATNDPINRVDYLGLSGCKCGPDITDLFYDYLRLILPKLQNLDSSETGPIDGLNKLWEMGGNIDFWYIGVESGCATEKCKRTVYFAGRCVRVSVVNNILFGFVANALGVSQDAAVVGGNRAAERVLELIGIEGRR